jgi:hypothetical protein
MIFGIEFVVFVVLEIVIFVFAMMIIIEVLVDRVAGAAE